MKSTNAQWCLLLYSVNNNRILQTELRVGIPIFCSCTFPSRHFNVLLPPKRIINAWVCCSKILSPSYYRNGNLYFQKRSKMITSTLTVICHAANIFKRIKNMGNKLYHIWCNITQNISFLDDIISSKAWLQIKKLR